MCSDVSDVKVIIFIYNGMNERLSGWMFYILMGKQSIIININIMLTGGTLID